ncbi:hypothetical protein H5410_055759 [Solanum commersonii]|uniref:Uncharacterized protein n=1 Tax=Solanum commersonii TaxID=4109 RepID=A0A9J5WIF5_SOLCO|nr:hypothetical protein H5410_055759 [Solanum commersonii]
MDISTTFHSEIIASHVPLSDVGLVCSLTLVLSGDKSQNSEAQSVVKPGAELVSEETKVRSMAVSSTISKGCLKEICQRKRVRSLREAEEERVKLKGMHKRARKTHAKKEKVTKQKFSEKEERVKKIVDEQAVKGPGPRVQNQREEEEMTREERIEKLEHQKVLNGSVFDTDIVTKFGLKTLFDVVTIQEWSYMSEPPAPYLHEHEVHEFFYKMELSKDGGITTTVKDIEICLDEETLGIILGFL